MFFWHKNAKVAIILNLKVSFVGFQELFLFWVAGMIFEAWEVEFEQDHFLVLDLLQ